MFILPLNKANILNRKQIYKYKKGTNNIVI